MLARGDISAGADNLLAAAALLDGDEDLFGAAGFVGKSNRPAAAHAHKGKLPAGAVSGEALQADGGRRAENTQLWEQLDSPEEFKRGYEESIAEAQSEIEEATFESADRSLDVRRMQLIHKQLTVAGKLAKQQEFFLPVDIGGRTARVHLTFERGAGAAGMVRINVRAGKEDKVQAAFRFEKEVLSGIIKNENQNEVMKTERIADIFKEEAGESWKLGDISVVSTDVRFSETAGVGMEAGIENVELYRVAKVFLHACIGEGSAEQEGVSYAN